MNQLTKTFHIDIISKVDSCRYHGSFTTKKLTMGDLSRMGMRKAQLAGGYNFDPETKHGIDAPTNMLNEMIIHCEVALVQKPDWFDPENMSDVDVLRGVYEEVASFEADFHSLEHEPKEQTTSGSSTDSGSVEYQGQGGGDSSSQDLVDKKVPKISQL